MPRKVKVSVNPRLNPNHLLQRFEYADQRMPLSMASNGTKYYLHYDQVGSLRAISDTNHNIIKEITYDTFGTILSDSNKAFKVPFGFAGGLYDTDSKLTRFGYRDYDAYTGKWTAKDPIDFAGGDSNLYGYVLGDPVGFVDPTGENPLLPLFVRVGAMAEGISVFAENLERITYNMMLQYEIDRLIYETRINCGCSMEEQSECAEQIKRYRLFYGGKTGIKKTMELLP